MARRVITNMDRAKAFYNDKSSHYIPHKIILFAIGQWPYQSTVSSLFMLSLTIILGPIVFVPQVIGLYEVRDKISDILECLPPIIFDLLTMVKLSNLIINRNKMKKLLTDLADDWRNAGSMEELRIINRYAKFGKTFAFLYIIYIYLSSAAFSLLPRFSASTLKRIPGTNKTIGIDMSPFIADYKLDVEKYYHLILCHSCTSIFVQSTIILGPQLLFVACIQHVCGMFDALCHELSEIMKNGDLDINLNPKLRDDEVYKKLSEIIKKHNHIIRYSKLIEASFTISLLFQITLNMLILSVTAVQVLVYANVPHELFRSGSFSAAQILHLFLECWQAQQLIDSANRVGHVAYTTHWYRVSLRSRKLLISIMMRANSPCQITAGKILTLSFPSFSKVIRTSVSYITVFRSMG
ncbi:putative odorant receptor 92a isoform X2 [Prorops nasuta]|uniref:putative odorant receptor 92a isoform X2 n=1 Tax=Prorops nasuta TaxID=863751 RepID=UPI0034CD4185